MSYRVEYSKNALRTLKKPDKPTRRLLISWIENNLEGCTDPRRRGKALSGDLNGLWRYRVGDYRLITEIVDDKIIIYILAIGHSRDIYKK